MRTVDRALALGLTEGEFDLICEKIGREPRDVDVQSYLMYPQVFLDYEKHLKQYDNTSVIPTPAFFYGLQSGEEINIDIEPGKRLIIRYLTTGDPHEDGTRTPVEEEPDS